MQLSDPFARRCQPGRTGGELPRAPLGHEASVLPVQVSGGSVHRWLFAHFSSIVLHRLSGGGLYLIMHNFCASGLHPNGHRDPGPPIPDLQINIDV